jgi:fatty-acyl-CoA synthase
MLGLMQDRPLLISSLVEHAATFHPDTEIVSRLPEGTVHRTNWRDMCLLSRQVAQAMQVLGVQAGDRVGTLAWNSYRHLSLYYGVSGSGAVLHTVNPRLFPEQIDYIINHAEDQVLFFDVGFAPLVAQLAPSLKTVKHYVVMTDRAHMPDVNLPNLHCFDELMAAQSSPYVWPAFDERSASSLCYTSGTTGNPKGVLYSHRSTMLHTLMELAPDTFGISSAETLLLIVPMFHANAWGAPYAAAMVGAKLVLPGPHLDGESIFNLMQQERVTFSQGVPTVWLMLFQYLDAHPELDPKTLGVKRVGIGGAAVARSMLERFEQQFGAEVVQGWGMTETSPVCAIGHPPKEMGDLSETDWRVKTGRVIPGVELRITDDSGAVVPWDGESLGEIEVRGSWITGSYYNVDDPEKFHDGWLRTGDVASVQPNGYVMISDRAKDVIKSGGEWVSSVDLENTIMGHPAVLEAAVIGVPDPRWDERPMACVVLKPGAEATAVELRDWLSERTAKFWLPERWSFITEVPKTSVGKFDKKVLRARHAAGDLDVELMS